MGVRISDRDGGTSDWVDQRNRHFSPFDPAEYGVKPEPGRDSPRSATVRQVMTRNARACRPDDTFAAAAKAMCEADCRFLPVVDRIGQPIGVITDGDICLLGSTDRRPLREILVREGMGRMPVTCRADHDVLEALKLMRERRIRHLPVVTAEGVLEGVLSLTDLLLLAEEEGSPRLRRDVAAALRAISQKRGATRVVRDNTFIED